MFTYPVFLALCVLVFVPLRMRIDRRCFCLCCSEAHHHSRWSFLLRLAAGPFCFVDRSVSQASCVQMLNPEIAAMHQIMLTCTNTCVSDRNCFLLKTSLLRPSFRLHSPVVSSIHSLVDDAFPADDHGTHAAPTAVGSCSHGEHPATDPRCSGERRSIGPGRVEDYAAVGSSLARQFRLEPAAPVSGNPDCNQR